MVSKERVRKLIGAYCAEGFVQVLKLACSPASFVSVGKEYTFQTGNDIKVHLLGVVKNLSGENGFPAPLLVTDVPLSTTLAERSSRIRQFKLAKKVLEYFAATPPMMLDGVIAQGIFVFHDKEGHFRVSLVTATPENGKFNWSKVRRQSFYVTNNPDANATFVQRMCMDWSTLNGIKDAFSVEKLTKEFYGQLFQWYERVCDDKRVEYPNGLDTDADNREDKNRKHILRLITRLMFVWFLKQKGLVPSTLFDEKELRHILKDFDPTSHKQHQYYRAILQNLFFATLNSEIDERGFASLSNSRTSGGKTMSRHYGIKTKYRYADEFAISRQKVLDLFSPIPFLNGGLFECLDQEDANGRVMYYDGFSMQERHRDRKTLTWAHVPNDLFFDPDYGIIPLLKRYNFTVEENSPGDEDVALDPELLGKVFENLLGAYNPETEAAVRNSTGSFYTPREIVNYMVDESLIAYLTTVINGDVSATKSAKGGGVQLVATVKKDAMNCVPPESTIRALVVDGIRPSDETLCKRLAETIENAKILDPACGSGAFPMGILLKMTELLRILRNLPEDANLYDLKLKLIENCIFGSDIQEIAVQISKLRIFISLVCEQKPNMAEPNYGINPLPNLETKFVAANSLIGLQKNKVRDLFFDTGEIQSIKDQLWDVRHRHFTAKTRQEKNKLRQEDKVLREKLVAAVKRIGFSEESTRLMASWDPYNQNVHAEFFDPEWMFNVKDGFDVVIGNPPYFVIKSDNPLKDAYETTFSKLKSGRVNIYQLFLGLGKKLLNSKGTLSYIHPKTLLGDAYLSATRSFLLENFAEVSILNIASRTDTFSAVLQSVIVTQWTVVANTGSDRVAEIVTKADLDEIKPLRVKRQDLVTDDGRILVSSNAKTYKIVQKVKSSSCRKLQFCTGSIEWNKYRATLSSSYNGKNCRLLFGENIQRFCRVESRRRIDSSYVGTPGLPILSYPAIVTQRTTAVEQPWRIIATYIDPAKEEIPIVTENSINVFVVESEISGKFYLGLLSSAFMDYYFRVFNSNTHVSSGELNSLPIPHATSKQRESIATFVDHILAAKKRNPAADTSVWERKIDELVYQLYGLTDDEIRVIEGTDEGGDGKGGSRRDGGSPSQAPKKCKPKFEEEF